MYVRVLFYLYTVYINTPQLLKGMPTYFIGNVLSPTNTQPEQDDPTFAFTREEAANLDLTDKPIRMEHHSSKFSVGSAHDMLTIAQNPGCRLRSAASYASPRTRNDLTQALVN